MEAPTPLPRAPQELTTKTVVRGDRDAANNAASSEPEDSSSDDGNNNATPSQTSSEERNQRQRDLDYEDERNALGKIVANIRAYRGFGEDDVRRVEYHYGRLSEAHKALIPHEREKHAAMRSAVDANARFFDELLNTFRDMNEGSPESHGRPSHLVGGEEEARKLEHSGYQISGVDEDKVKYVLKNLVRDWSEEGKNERERSYRYVIDALRRSCPAQGRGTPPPDDKPTTSSAKATTSAEASSELVAAASAAAASGGNAATNNAGPATSTPPSAPMDHHLEHRSEPPRCVVAGAGLGRLCCELAALGYDAQGNEHSYYMLLTSSFVLNHTQRRHQWRIHPWAHQSCNVARDSDQLRCVTIPDVTPGELACRVSPGLLSMCAGDFVEVYGVPEQAGAYDAVITCFFMDTAHNVLEYLEVIRHMLKVGGIWINHGPLLYHWADAFQYLSTDELSIEISLETMHAAAEKLGFECLHQEMVVSPYTSNVHSMMQTIYNCSSSTMVKRR